jgi:hypothetical protein
MQKLVKYVWFDISFCRIYYKLKINKFRMEELLCSMFQYHCSMSMELQKNFLNPSVDSVSALSAFGKHPLFHKPPQSVLHL